MWTRVLAKMICQRHIEDHIYLEKPNHNLDCLVVRKGRDKKLTMISEQDAHQEESVEM